MRKRFIASLFAAALLSGCNANIVGQDNSKLLAQLTPTFSGSIPNPWYLYSDGLNTGDWLRGLDFFFGGSFVGTPVIDFADTTSPDNGSKCWKFSIPAQTGGWYCGVILLQGTGFGDSGSRPGVDISTGNFSKCVFRARTLQGGQQVSFKAFDNGANAITVTMTSAWTTYTIPLSNASAISNMKQFFTIVFANAAPATATPIDLFIDDLRFEQ
jgi:hypothetical protein